MYGSNYNGNNYLCRLVQFSAHDGGTKLFFTRSIWPFYGFYNANEEYERRFFPNAYDSYPGSDYRQQFGGKEMAPRQSPSLASMEARQSPSLGSIPSVESSTSAESSNTNDNKGKKKAKYETWSQAEQKVNQRSFGQNMSVWCDRRQKLELAKFLPIFFLAKNWKYLKYLNSL